MEGSPKALYYDPVLDGYDPYGPLGGTDLITHKEHGKQSHSITLKWWVKGFWHWQNKSKDKCCLFDHSLFMFGWTVSVSQK